MARHGKTRMLSHVSLRVIYRDTSFGLIELDNGADVKDQID